VRGTYFGVRWQAERDTALDRHGQLLDFNRAEIQSAVAATLCRRTPSFTSQEIEE
jgi:hypothetical protein